MTTTEQVLKHQAETEHQHQARVFDTLLHRAHQNVPDVHNVTWATSVAQDVTTSRAVTFPASLGDAIWNACHHQPVTCPDCGEILSEKWTL
jgi:hypothetical protein